jgi:hypothetical protein
VKKREFNDRVWESKFAEPFFEEARRKLELERKQL